MEACVLMKMAGFAMAIRSILPLFCTILNLKKSQHRPFFEKAGNNKTALFRIGNWTRTFNGEPIDGNKLLPENMLEVPDYEVAFEKVLEVLKVREVQAQTPATAILDSNYFKLRGYEHTSYFPPNTGFSRLIDGTHLLIAGTKNVSGDTIQSNFKIKDFDVSVDAIGVVGVRLDDDGNLDALVASDLSRFKVGDFSITLDKRMDIALWKNQKNKWEGVIQIDKEEKVPDELMKITDNWTFLHLPIPPSAIAN